jgi:hypothetical protein
MAEDRGQKLRSWEGEKVKWERLKAHGARHRAKKEGEKAKQSS